MSLLVREQARRPLLPLRGLEVPLDNIPSFSVHFVGRGINALSPSFLGFMPSPHIVAYTRTV